MEFFVQTACNNKLTANISDWVQKSSIPEMVAMLWSHTVIKSNNYLGLTEVDSWPDKILLPELKNF